MTLFALNVADEKAINYLYSKLEVGILRNNLLSEIFA